VVYEERAKAWTEAPATLEQLYRQRYRWSYGTMQAMWKHRKALTERGPSGRFGRRGLPFLALFGVALPMFAPVVDIMLLYGLVFWELQETLVAWTGMLLLQILTAVVAFRFDREKLGPILRLPLQQFAYRQLMYLVLIQSATTALTGGRLGWHKLRRAGLVRAAPLVAELDPDKQVAPEVDSWPPTLHEVKVIRHPAAGRARPTPAAQPTREDLPSAGSPPGGGSGPVRTG
jgi:cellulose synthase/poly-beta-1,6-N-acetylglucosamine synthase-like glycosyltransferase